MYWLKVEFIQDIKAAAGKQHTKIPIGENPKKNRDL